MGEGNIFSLFTLAEGGGTPSQVLGGVNHLRSEVGGYPIPGMGWGVPQPGLDGGGTPGTPHPGMGYPQPGLDEGGVPWVPPSPPWDGYPLDLRWGTPPPSRPGWGTDWTWDGVPLPDLRWGTPPDLGWGTPPGPGMGYPPDLRWDTPHPLDRSA